MRMSSGPSKRNEKPRAGLSICGELTPRSSSTPLTRVTPSAASLGQIAPKPSWRIEKRASRDVGAACGDGLRVLVEGDQPAARRQPLEQRAGMAAAAEGGIDIDAVGCADEGLDGLVQQDGAVRPGTARRVHQKTKSLTASGISDAITCCSCAA